MLYSRHLIIIFTCAFVASCSVPLAQKNGSIALIDAQKFQMNGHFDAARITYFDALKSHRDDIRAEAYYELSRIDLMEDQYESHIQNLEMAAHLSHERYNKNLAFAYKKYGTEAQKLMAQDMFLMLQDNADANLALADYAIEENDKEQALSYLKTARDLLMNEPDEDGQNALKIARTYHDFDLVTPNFEQAEYWYRQSVSLGNQDAAYELGSMWVDHHLRSSAKKDAFALILQTANQGHEKSMLYIANAYDKGIGADINHDKAMEWYQKLTKFDNRQAYDYLAEAYMRDMKPNSKSIPSSVVEMYENAQKSGSSKGLLVRSIWGNQSDIIDNLTDEDVLKEARYLESIWGHQQPALKKKLYMVMADRNIVDALVYLADGYYMGVDGFEKNHDKAISYYMHAAKLGNAQGLLKIAESYSSDPENMTAITKAFEFYQKAAVSGNGEGQYQTGLMLARGIGVQQDLDMAKSWLSKATKNGYPLALKILETLDQDNG